MNDHVGLADQPVKASLLTRTVVVCDDRQEIRDAISGLVALLPDLELVGTAGDAHAGLAIVRSARPDVLIMDVNMPGGGPDAARTARAIHPTMHIIVFSGQSGDEVRDQMLGAGADQYVVKTGRLTPLMSALRQAGGEPPQLPMQRGR